MAAFNYVNTKEMFLIAVRRCYPVSFTLENAKKCDNVHVITNSKLSQCYIINVRPAFRYWNHVNMADFYMVPPPKNSISVNNVITIIVFS
jgi:hypothetical protein